VSRNALILVSLLWVQGLLETLWEVATYARYAEEEGLAAGGGSLTPLQGQKARLKYPPPRTIGGAGTGD
jgi:hypothetical protein